MLLRIPIKLRTPKAAISLFVLVVILFGSFARGGTTSTSSYLSSAISCKNGEWESSQYFSGSLSNCPDIVEYLFKPAFVNEKASELNLRFVTMPSGKFGSPMRNSGWVTESYFIDVDTTDAQRIFNKDGSSSQGVTLRAKMSKNNSLFYFPFDRYSGEIKVQAISEISKEPIPATVITSNSTLSGWKLYFSESKKPSKATSNKAIYENGRATLNWKMSRANVVFISVTVLLLLMIIALGSAFAITRSISRYRRPPSMNLLLWLATVLFAILQVRTNFPGNPPIGILLDFTVVFPVLGLLLILGIANTFYWLKRSDWDFENENPELIKNA
jgi:hypothetical protein